MDSEHSPPNTHSKKGILKAHSGQSRPKRAKIVWSEENLAQNEREKTPKMKINEPKTPFVSYILPDDAELPPPMPLLDAPVDPVAIWPSSPPETQHFESHMKSLSDAFSKKELKLHPRSFHSSDESGSEMEAGYSSSGSDCSSKKVEQFQQRRKAHYNEFKMAQLLRQKPADEEEEGEGGGAEQQGGDGRESKSRTSDQAPIESPSGNGESSKMEKRRPTGLLKLSVAGESGDAAGPISPKQTFLNSPTSKSAATTTSQTPFGAIVPGASFSIGVAGGQRCSPTRKGQKVSIEISGLSPRSAKLRTMTTSSATSQPPPPAPPTEKSTDDSTKTKPKSKPISISTPAAAVADQSKSASTSKSGGAIPISGDPKSAPPPPPQSGPRVSFIDEANDYFHYEMPEHSYEGMRGHADDENENSDTTSTTTTNDLDFEESWGSEGEELGHQSGLENEETHELSRSLNATNISPGEGSFYFADAEGEAAGRTRVKSARSTSFSDVEMDTGRVTKP